MDTTVTHLGAVVIAALRAAGYEDSTIGQYQKTIRALSAFAAKRGARYTPALGAEFASRTTSPRTGRFSVQRRFDYGRLVNLLDGYVRSGHVDLSVRKRGGGGPQPVSAAFTALNAAWEAEMAERGLAPATRAAYGRIARSYLVFLEGCGVRVLDGADAASVLAFLESLLDSWAKSSLFWVVSNFRPFLTFTGRRDLAEALRLTGVRRSHVILPFLGDEDARTLAQTCASRVISARDASITLLALTTGLRACDIIGLRLEDIDWRSRTISILQQKTNNLVTLPIPPLLAARLADYLLGERPDSGDPHVFLRVKAPHTRLCDHASIHRVTAEVSRKSGITGVKAGTRFLRHSAASRLLRAAVALPTISAVLGHASTESAKVYLSVDDQRLRACVLPVPAGARP